MASVQLWQNATIATMVGNDYGLIPNGAILVVDGKIEWIGNNATWNPSQSPFAESISVEGALITPGLIDCHTHLVYGGNRALEWMDKLAGKSYDQLAIEKRGIYSTVKETRELSEEELLTASLKRAHAMLKEGVTTIEIKSGYGLDLITEQKILRVAKKIGEKLPIDVHTTFLGAHMLPEEFSNKEDYIHYLSNDVLPALVAEKLIDAVDGYCENIAFDDSQLERLFLQALKHSLKLKIHCDQLQPGKGSALIAKYQGLSADHLEYLDEQGAQSLKKAGTIAVLLPGAHYFLQQTKTPPIELLRQYKIPIAVATDCNPGTSPTTSLPLMMNMACTLFSLTPLEALQATTVHASAALGLDKGRLKVGAPADFVVWNACMPIELSYYFGVSLCRKVIKHGKVVYEA